MAIDDEFFYGGESVPIGDPSADTDPDEAQVVSDMFFVAQGSLLIAEFEAIVTRPTLLSGMDEPKVFVVATFKGRVNNENKLGAVTIIMTPTVAREFLKVNRALYARIPLEHRED